MSIDQNENCHPEVALAIALFAIIGFVMGLGLACLIGVF